MTTTTSTVPPPLDRHRDVMIPILKVSFLTSEQEHVSDDDVDSCHHARDDMLSTTGSISRRGCLCQTAPATLLSSRTQGSIAANRGFAAQPSKDTYRLLNLRALQELSLVTNVLALLAHPNHRSFVEQNLPTISKYNFALFNVLILSNRLQGLMLGLLVKFSRPERSRFCMIYYCHRA